VDEELTRLYVAFVAAVIDRDADGNSHDVASAPGNRADEVIRARAYFI
jgi:hypothetical protein